MKSDLLKEALIKRRGRNFNPKDFMNEDSEEAIDGEGCEPGLDSKDLKEKTGVVMGKGVNEKKLGRSSHSTGSSTDDLSPSDQEMKAKGLEVSKSDKKNDEDVFDDNEYEKIKRKKKPKGLYERMQMALGEKLNK